MIERTNSINLRETARELYDASPRPYHNWAHVEACLRELDAVRSLCDRPDLVEIALWFHDAVYDARRSDNEAQSATAAEDAMSSVNFPPVDVAVVRQLILDTCHHAEPATNDGRLVVDIDLSILGQPVDVFTAYEAAIRQEYAHVADADFARGRAAVLRKFLDRPAIYATPYFREKYERRARANLVDAIRRWTH